MLRLRAFPKRCALRQWICRRGTREQSQLNNNRGNNRRRGRNNRSQGGGQHLNRIDSRARGNAPQLLDKYKKLAEEAHRNGDRVQAEYYLQFADHYFRVIADGKARQDEQRQRREDERPDREIDDEAEGQDNETESEFESAQHRRRRKETGDDNPFTRESRQRRQRRQSDEDDRDTRDETEDAVENDGSLDPQALPPAIGETEERPARRGRPRKVTDEAPAAGDDEKPKRRGRPRKVKPEGPGDNEDVREAVNG